MKKLFMRILMLLILIIITDFLLGIILKQVLLHSPDGRYYKAYASLNERTDDVVILGSSRAETNYAPYIFEDSLSLSCWNAGRGGQKLPFWYAMSMGILKRYTPKIAIVNIEDDFLTDDLTDGYEHAGLLRPFYYDNPEIRPVIDRISKFERFLMLSKTYAYNSSFYYLFRPYFIKGLDGDREDKGWKTKKGNISVNDSGYIRVVTAKKLNNQTLELFEKFIDNLTSRGCQVYLVISPDYKRYFESTATIKYIEKMDNVNYINLSCDTSIANNQKYFIDSSHLNVNGAIAFSKKLGSEIVRYEREKPNINNRAEEYVLNRAFTNRNRK